MEERKLSASIQKTLSDYFIKQYEDYRDSVLNGSRVSSYLEKRMIERQEEDLKRKWQWSFNWNKAVKPLIWFAANLKFPSGDKKGKPLKLEKWQVWIIMVLFGWVNSEGNRRFCDAYVEIARKNGKSTLMGAVCDYLAFASEEANGNPCYIAATSLDQAAECFERAYAELDGMDVKVQDSKNNKRIVWGENRVIAISAEPKDGKLCHGAVIDEYHQHKSNELINSITSGNVSDPNVMVIRITTAGTSLNGVCKQEHDKGIKILEGSISMERYFFAIYTIDDTDSADDPSVWAKANPNYGVSVDAEMLKSRYDYSKSSATDMITFKTKNLNVWVNSLQRWAKMDVWIEMCSTPYDARELEGQTCYAGLDLSHNSDFTAFVLDFPQAEVHKQLYWYFIPEARIVELERTLVAPITQWVADGYITATPGQIIDYDYVARTIQECREMYDIKLIAADRWHLSILDQHMPACFSELSVEFSQGWKTMSSATSNYERAYLSGIIQSNANPVQRWMMSCAESRADINGNVKIIKPDVTKSQARIDGVIASIMAFDTAVTQEGTGIDGNINDVLMFC